MPRTRKHEGRYPKHKLTRESYRMLWYRSDKLPIRATDCQWYCMVCDTPRRHNATCTQEERDHQVVLHLAARTGGPIPPLSVLGVANLQKEKRDPKIIGIRSQFAHGSAGYLKASSEAGIRAHEDMMMNDVEEGEVAFNDLPWLEQYWRDSLSKTLPMLRGLTLRTATSNEWRSIWRDVRVPVPDPCSQDDPTPENFMLEGADIVVVDVGMFFPNLFDATTFKCVQCDEVSTPSRPIKRRGFRKGFRVVKHFSGRLQLLKIAEYGHVNCPAAAGRGRRSSVFGAMHQKAYAQYDPIIRKKLSFTINDKLALPDSLLKIVKYGHNNGLSYRSLQRTHQAAFAAESKRKDSLEQLVRKRQMLAHPSAAMSVPAVPAAAASSSTDPSPLEMMAGQATTAIAALAGAEPIPSAAEVAAAAAANMQQPAAAYMAARGHARIPSNHVCLTSISKRKFTRLGDGDGNSKAEVQNRATAAMAAAAATAAAATAAATTHSDAVIKQATV